MPPASTPLPIHLLFLGQDFPRAILDGMSFAFHDQLITRYPSLLSPAGPGGETAATVPGTWCCWDQGAGTGIPQHVGLLLILLLLLLMLLLLVLLLVLLLLLLLVLLFLLFSYYYYHYYYYHYYYYWGCFG